MEVLLPMLSKGGPTAIAVAIFVCVRWLFDARTASRKGASEEASSSTNDLATANALLMSSLKSEREEVSKLRVENDGLRKERDDLTDELFDTRRDYEAQLEVIRRQLAGMTLKVDALQAALKQSPPPH